MSESIDDDAIADLAKLATNPALDLSAWRADRLYMTDLAYWDGINRGVVTEKGRAILAAHGLKAAADASGNVQERK